MIKLLLWWPIVNFFILVKICLRELVLWIATSDVLVALDVSKTVLSLTIHPPAPTPGCIGAESFFAIHHVVSKGI